MPSPVLEYRNVTKRYGELTAVDQLNLTIRRGEFVTLVGPSGSGKTTTLRMAAGLERPSSGDIYLDGEIVNELPANKRDVNTVFQNYALFPHMNVYENVSYSLRIRGEGKEETKERVEEIMRLVELSGYGEKMPNELSGGEQQRVALARSLINEPKLLLLDEPLGALDANLRKDMQRELQEIHDRVGITFLYVTHDQEEALMMSDRIGVMSRGRLLQVGPPNEVYDKPRTFFVANFLGSANLIEGRLKSSNGTQARIDLGEKQELSCGLMQSGENIPHSEGDVVNLMVRPEKISLSAPGQPRHNGGNRMSGTVQDVFFAGRTFEYVIQCEQDQVIRVLVLSRNAHSRFQPGDRVNLTWDPKDCYLLE